VGPFKIAGCLFPDKGYNPVALLENIRYPPVKGWLVVNADGHGILGGRKWVRFFEVRKAFPGKLTIFPLAANLPSNGIPLHIGTSVRSDDLLVCRSYRRVKASMVNKRVKESVLVPIGVALRIHGLCNQVCIQFSLITILELHNILTCVEDRVGISLSNGVAVSVPLA